MQHERSACSLTPAEAGALCCEKPTSSSHMKKQRGSSLLTRNVNLASIKASVGTSVDNRKSLFIKKHPVVGPGVCGAFCGMEPHISRYCMSTGQSHHMSECKKYRYVFIRTGCTDCASVREPLCLT